MRPLKEDAEKKFGRVPDLRLNGTDMKLKTIILSLVLAFTLSACGGEDGSAPLMKKSNPSVTLQTSKGDITLELYADKTPKTVENFVGLAKAGKYDGVPFHRVIEDFMIQSGDYENQNGTGGKSIWGTEFENEIVPELSHVRGVISMANRGPDTNGSQFFIVHAPDTKYLDGKHTIFGHVTDGMDTVDAIASSATDMMDRPLEPIIIESVSIQ